MFKPVQQNPNFPEIEKETIEHWYHDGIVEKYLHKNDQTKETFSFIDGPITANNPMGVHHAWGRSYKDLWQKFHNLLGFRQRFQNGFDCQGLWVEVEVEKELKLRSKKDIENLIPGDRKASIAKFVQMCKDRVHKFSQIQSNQSKRLGYLMDWNHSYFTMSDENNYMIWQFLKKCYEYGWIYKGHESVPWCPRCETAISQHEMLTEDYKEVVHESLFIEVPVVGRSNEYLIFWTTTPWTIPANIAIAIDENIDYSLVEGETGNSYWVAKDLVEQVFKPTNPKMQKKGYKKIVKTVKGKELVGLKYTGPFDMLPAVQEVKNKNPQTFHTVVATDALIMPISTTEGTGLVHTAVSAGTEDFLLGKKLGLPMIPVIEDDASYLPGLGEFTGKNAKKHPELIIDYLKSYQDGSFLFATLPYKHRYPACWRCKAELVWKVADEWYIAMDKKAKIQNPKSKIQNDNTFRERMIEVAKQITWMPDFGLERELDWLKNMHDWLISKKNRYWGLALPIYECDHCKTFEVIGSKDELKQRAVAGWDQFEGKSPHKPYIDEVTINCSSCKKPMKRIEDVGNPWLDAGIVAYSTIKDHNMGEPLYWKNKDAWKDWVPATFITESFPGQFKNWFYALIAESTVLEGIPPCKRILGYGTLLGEDGRPMHKSWGNSIEFNEGADKIGIDVMRWMFARQNPAENMLFGYKKADEVRRQFYLMLWNSYKFFVDYAILEKIQISDTTGNISPDSVENILDSWILHRLTQTIQNTEKFLKEFNPRDASGTIEEFVSDLSTWFIRRSRNRVWTNSDKITDKAEFYQTFYTVLVNLSIIISPFVPVLSDLMYVNLTGKESVHLSSWPKSVSGFDHKLIADMKAIRKMAEAGHRTRKEQKLKVRQPLSKATLSTIPEYSFALEKNIPAYKALLKEELNVKGIDINLDKKKSEITIVFDTQLTPELEKEGKLRDLVRQVQEQRKKANILPVEQIDITLPKEFKEFEGIIMRKVLARTITWGEKVEISI